MFIAFDFNQVLLSPPIPTQVFIGCDLMLEWLVLSRHKVQPRGFALMWVTFIGRPLFIESCGFNGELPVVTVEMFVFLLKRNPL